MTVSITTTTNSRDEEDEIGHRRYLHHLGALGDLVGHLPVLLVRLLRQLQAAMRLHLNTQAAAGEIETASHLTSSW